MALGIDTQRTAPRRASHAPGGRWQDALGDRLLEIGAISLRDLTLLRHQTARHRVGLAHAAQVLAGVSADAVAQAEARVLGTTVLDPLAETPDARLIAALGPERCLRDGLLPVAGRGGCALILTCRPEAAAAHLPDLTERLGPVRLAVAREDRLITALARTAERSLALRAERRTPAHLSCRGWTPRRTAGWALALLSPIGAGLALAPGATLLSVLVLATVTSVLLTALKAAAGLAALRTAPRREGMAPVDRAALPTVTLLVPLYRERRIAAHLLARLQALDYPRDLLDILLVLEADDATTRAAIANVSLPPWIRPLRVPAGTLTTKPRALNYALDFARGEIVGVYDAEDAPAPDQISRVVQGFAERSPQVACLQGVLDFYNSRANWLTRCFTLEYAAWFRIVLPGLTRLGLPIPLGGTTLFFRRAVLEQLGAWDAHNVTEDADLGLRLARYGYRTELIDTVTGEEANGRVLSWMRQRSRWLKGYAVTYAVHMRRPAQLWKELGPWRFCGVQVLYLGTVLSFALAPVLWACWALALLPSPLGPLPTGLVVTLVALFLSAEAVNLAVAIVAARRAGRPGLAWWAPTLMAYFPLATAAVLKGLWEVVVRPFYWHKTEHGLFLPDTVLFGTRAPGTQGPITPRPPRPPRPAAGG